MNEVSSRPPAISILLILALLLLGFVIIGPLLGLAIGSMVYDGNLLFDLNEPGKHPGIRNGLLVMQGVAALVGLIVMPWLYLRYMERRSLAGLFQNLYRPGLIIVIIMVTTLFLVVAISPVVEWNDSLVFPDWMKGFGQWAKETEKQAAELIKVITKDMTPGSFALTFVVVAIIPAIGEEIMFRGLLQTELARAFKNPHLGIWFASILFSAIHLQFMGFVPRVLIGAFLGYLYFWSGTLWLPALAHFFNNGLQLIAVYLYQLGYISVDMESTEAAPWPAALFSLLAVGGIMIYLKNSLKTKPAFPS